LHSKIIKFSCPDGQALQEVNLITGQSKCTGDASPSGKCGTAINSCTSGVKTDIPDTADNYL
jgi:hypothetical protein